MRRAQALRRSEALNVSLGGVHHCVGVPLGQEDPLALPDAGGAGVRQVGLQGRTQDGQRHLRGQAQDQGALRGAGEN